MRLSSILGALVLLSGCYGHIPVEIRDPAPDNPRLPEVRQDARSFIGRPVRWGGAIVKVDNLENETWIELVAKGLGDYGRPRDVDESDGRFIARVPGFLDPAIYREGREVTVYGRIEAGIERSIGEKRYSYPLVVVETLYLWPDFEERRYAYDPYYFFPYYYPAPYPYHGYYGYYGYSGYPYWPFRDPHDR
jgi:outer membrane lipoprotein